MLDYIKSLNLSDELKINELYNLFKTDSSDFNLQLLSNLQKFQKTNEFLCWYSKQNGENAFELFNNLNVITSKISEETEQKIANSPIDKYISDISKIILLISLIHKNNELLNHLLKTTKKILKNFFIRNNSKSVLKEKINNCINDLMNHSTITSQRNYSRRSTKEKTINSPILSNGFNLGKSKQFDDVSNEDEGFLFFQCNTPKFEEEENEIVEVNEEQSISNNINSNKNINININNNNNIDPINNYTKLDSKKTIGSTLSLKHMKFIYNADEGKSRTVKKNKTFKIGIDGFNAKKFFKKKSISKDEDDNKHFEEDDNSENNQTEKIIAKFLSTINYLFKNGKINSQEKLAIKQLIITDTKSIIKRYNEYNLSNNFFNINNSSKCIKTFLKEEIKKLK